MVEKKEAKDEELLELTEEEKALLEVARKIIERKEIKPIKVPKKPLELPTPKIPPTAPAPEVPARVDLTSLAKILSKSTEIITKRIDSLYLELSRIRELLDKSKPYYKDWEIYIPYEDKVIPASSSYTLLLLIDSRYTVYLRRAYADRVEDLKYTWYFDNVPYTQNLVEFEGALTVKESIKLVVVNTSTTDYKIDIVLKGFGRLRERGI